MSDRRKRGRVVATQRVFIVPNATRRILETDAEILACEKWTWARVPDGRRFLLGSTAFYTKRSAVARKAWLLRQVAESGVLARMWRTQSMWANARKQLADYQASGTLH